MSFASLKRFRRAHHGLAYFVAGVLVLMALAGLAASQILPLAERHPERIAGWLSDRAGREVRFDAVDTEWTRRGPLLKLDNLRIGSGAEMVRIGDAEMLVSQYAGLLPGRSFTELRVRGLDITIERDAMRRWRVRGLPGQEGGGDPLESLESLGELQLVGARLRVLAPALGIDARVPQAHLRLRVDGDRVRAGMRAWMRAGGAPVEGVLDFDREEGDGRLWFSAPDADLAEWSPLLRVAGVRALAGSGDAQAWARLQARRLVRIDADLDLHDLAFAGTPAEPGAVPPVTAVGALAGRLRWRVDESSWRLDVPRLAFGDGAQAPRVEGLALAGGNGSRGLAATRIDIAPLVAVASLSDRLRPGLRAWLHAARPRGSLRDVALSGTRDGALRASGTLDAAGFSAAGASPGVQGLSGRFEGDAEGLRLRPEPAATLVVGWPRQYDAPHPVRLGGDILGWREGNGWRVGTSALRVDGDGYAADVRGGMWFQGDGSRPRVDLAIDIDPVEVQVAHKFWMRGMMSPAAVRWLEGGLRGGRVTNARAVVSGDLDDWPFRDRDGLFHAAASIEDAVVKFHQDWPEARGLDAEVDFVADGFSVHGRRASLAEVAVGGFSAGIERFGDAVLKIDAESGGDASRLLALLRQSPLRAAYGETLDQLEASGATRVQFAMERSLRRGAGPGTLQGTVVADKLRLVEKRWDLAFTDVTGEARYGLDGFAADELSVVHQQRPGQLSLRAGGFVRDAAHAFEAELESRLDAATLLQRAPELGWLQGRVSGTSPWSVAVALPKGRDGEAAPSRLRLRSSLAGTALDLPAPLDKPAGTSLPTTIDVALPMDRGDIEIAFGQRMALRARSRGGRTGVRVALGSNRVDGEVPAEGLVASGRGQRLDAIGWVTLATADGGDARESGAGGGLTLRDVDISVADLRMIGASFPDTHLRAVPAPGGTAVRLDGPALNGALMLPRGSSGAIAGRFDRLYWRAAKPVDGMPATGATRMVATRTVGKRAADDVDPSKVPPLNLAVDDFRFGDARLGTAGLRTRPTATGMRIEQLQTRAPKQSLDMTGDWSRQAGIARTRLELNATSTDFGALLAGFGFGRQVEGGEGSIELRARWPGSPADFSLAGMGGTMAVDLRDGQLVQVEPGAGRVLGLLSIAQLPRRLSFDFSDFFEKGFAFDSIEGDVRFDAGRAHSDDLAIDGPAANIRMRGSADLRAQTYDQTIDVYPKAGNLLTVAGALAGGPVGAAIGAAANAVLQKPIGQLTARTYRITGPWKEPKVETVARGNGAAAASTKDPPADTR